MEDSVDIQDASRGKEEIVESVKKGVKRAKEFFGEELSAKYLPDGREIKEITIETNGREVWEEYPYQSNGRGQVLHVFFADGSEVAALRRKPAETPFQRMMVSLAMLSEVDMSDRQWKVDSVAAWDGKNKLSTEIREKIGASFTHTDYVTEDGETTFITQRPGEEPKTEKVKGEYATSLDGFIGVFRDSIPGSSDTDQRIERFSPKVNFS